MPLFCAISSGISALCYLREWRVISLFSCLIGNTISFLYVHNNGSPYPLHGDEAIIKDIIFSYYVTTIALFIAICLIIIEVRKYKISQDVLQTYFDISVRKEILKKAYNGELSKISEKKKAVILFADISRFTTATEKMSPEKAAQFLNEFFTISEGYIHETNGIIDKYIGDCVMAYWFYSDDSNCVLNAVKAVLNMKKELYKKSEYFFTEYGTELNFSAGIAYGDVIFGNIGSDNMHDYTIIGDAVNTASRIETYASGGEVLLSNDAAKMIKNSAELEIVETDMYFKGKSKSVNLYRVLRLIDGETDTNIDTPSSLYNLYICGCRGSFPVSGLRFSEYGGETSCYVLKKGTYALIIDCGTGLKNATDLISDCTKIDILLTHVHYDHILGLLTSKLPPNVPTRMFGRFDIWSSNSSTLTNFMEHPYWPIGISKMENINVILNEEIQLEEGIKATFYRSDHPDDACVIKLICNDKKLCIFADCEDANKLDPEISKDSDILLFDGMFDNNDTIDHTGWGHGTWQNGVDFAKKQNIKKLIITHHNPELGDHTLLNKEQQARTMLKNVSFAKSGDCIEI